MTIPELSGLESTKGLVRIPPELDVPVTGRVRRLIDTPAFRRLTKISQLGLVSLVYPAAHHHRFEHSLGVYRLTLLFLSQLGQDTRFCKSIDEAHSEQLILAALLHDIGHWPFCHLIEDLQLADIPAHESFARRYLLDDEIAEAIRSDWSVSPESVASLLNGESVEPEQRLLSSILSGPIDVDKMDYLMRDSLHAGVPYGRNFDQARLIASLCLNRAGDGLALTEKGRTAAEMMVFARYVMFSEVYWHHAVRSATAMFQRAFYRLYAQIDLEHLFSLGDAAFVRVLQQTATSAAQPTVLPQILDGLFGNRRQLYKRWLECRFTDSPELYGRLARQPYAQLTEYSRKLAERVGQELGISVDEDEILIDAPPTKREVQFKVDILHPKTQQYRSLVDVSPVVRTLAEQQFDDYVKRVRIFVHPRLQKPLESIDAPEIIIAAHV